MSGGFVAARARLSERFHVIAVLWSRSAERKADTSLDLLNKDIRMCAFNIFDNDGDVKITNRDLRKVMGKGSLVRDIAGKLDALVKYVARNGDGTSDHEPGAFRDAALRLSLDLAACLCILWLLGFVRPQRVCRPRCSSASYREPHGHGAQARPYPHIGLQGMLTPECFTGQLTFRGAEAGGVFLVNSKAIEQRFWLTHCAVLAADLVVLDNAVLT